MLKQKVDLVAVEEEPYVLYGLELLLQVAIPVQIAAAHPQIIEATISKGRRRRE